jgi:HAD superfamily hydrolase (TIGR01459 family)
MPIFHKNITELAKDYQYFILDIWGVIHDGNKLYPKIIDRLKYLRSLNKKICFLSNAPRRAYIAEAVLNNFGITKDLYDFIFTSGEATYLFLQDSINNSLKLKNLIGGNLKNDHQYYYIGPQKDSDLLHGSGYLPNDDASKADFAVATGFDNDFSTISEKMSQLQEAKKNNLTMICVNPDLIVVRQNGLKMICAGQLAIEYQKIGGKVAYFGKPYNLVYEQVLRLFSIEDKSKILAIGDAIETDILGANNNKIDSALLAGGILASELNIKYGELPNIDLLQKVCNKHQSYPKFVIGNL